MKKICSILALCMTLGFVPTVHAVESVDYSEEISTLKSLLDRCKTAGIPTDYETVNYKTIERFEGYINDDIKNYPGENKDEMVAYNISCMDELYIEAKSNLEAYLNGTKETFEVDRPDMMNLSNEKGMLISDGKPAFSIGYGHFNTAYNDIPNFPDFGTNNIQMEVGPSHVYTRYGWTKMVKNDPICTYEVDNSVYYDGDSSVKITFTTEKEDDHYILLHQTVPVTPGKTYVLKGMIKGTNIVHAFMSVNSWSRNRNFNKGTYDWTEYSYEYTAPAGTNSAVVRLFVDGLAESIYFDGFTFCEKGTVNNLLYNGSFDDFETVDYYFNPESAGIKNLKNVLENGAKNNVGVTLLISPHYMLDNLSKEAYNSSAPGFLGYNINHPEALAVLEEYLNNLLPMLKNYPALTSICLSNEPLFETTDFYSFYNTQFREYLKSIHGNIENLNKKYGTKYPSFSWISMPTNNLSSRNALAYDWMMFNDKVLADWHKWLYDIVKKHLPDVPVHNKMMGYFRKSNEEETNTQWIARGTDLELLGESSDFAGNDTWDYIDEPNRYYESMFLYDYQLSVLDKPVYNSEDHIIQDGNAEFSYNQRVHLRNNLWMGAAHGRSMSSFWVWQREQNETSSMYNSVLYRPDCVAVTGKTNLDLLRLSKEMSTIQQSQPKVGIFYSKSSRLYDSYYLKTLFDTYREILCAGQKVGVVSDRSISKLSEYDVIVMPDVAYGTDSTYEALVNYTGKILYSGELLSYTEYKQSRNNSTLLAKSYKIGAKSIAEYFAELGVSEITLVDEATGKAPENMDWSYVISGNNVLINVSNISYENTKNVSVYIGGVKCTDMTNLITGEKKIETLSLEGHVPQLISTYINKIENAEIDTISIDTANKTINWSYSTDGYEYAKVYKLSEGGVASLIGKETDTDFSYSSEGTYVVRAVRADGSESEGKSITVASDKPFTVTIDSMDYKNGYVNGYVTVKNNNSTFTTGVVVIRVVSSTGDVSNYFYDYLTMPPYMKNTIRISMDGRGSVEVVEAYVCTDLISRNLSSEVIRYVESN